jgi:hypothetical protein
MDRADAVANGTGSAPENQITASGCVQPLPTATASYRDPRDQVRCVRWLSGRDARTAPRRTPI